MIFVKLHGGFGNELFQIAFGLAMEKKAKRPVFFDISKLTKTQRQKLFSFLPCLRIRCIGSQLFYLTKKTYGNLFCKPISKAMASPHSIKTIQNSFLRYPFEIFEPKHSFSSEIENYKGVRYFDGYWQSQKYFTCRHDVIMKMFREAFEKVFIPSHIKKWVAAKKPVAIHVRRTDYQKYPHSEVHHLLPVQYYSECMQRVCKGDPRRVFLIFSDDPDWAKNFLNFYPKKTVFAADYNLNDLQEFALMASCNDFIIANSSFSWWAAFLSKNSDKRVYFPIQWFKQRKLATQDMFPDSWLPVHTSRQKKTFPTHLRLHTSKSKLRYDVIIPCHQAEAFVSEAISSALNQSYPPNKILVVDDGCTDCTESKVNLFTKRHPNQVCLLKHGLNRGLSAARNTGIRNSNAQVLAFLDSDDFWAKTKIEEQINILMRDKSRNIGAVSAFHYSVDEHGYTKKEIYDQIFSFNKGSFQKLLYEGNLFSGGSGAIVRRSVLDDVGGFNEKLSSFEDLDLWIRIAEKYSLVSYPNPLYYVRVHGNSMSNNKIKMISENLKMLLLHYDKISDKKKINHVIFQTLFRLKTASCQKFPIHEIIEPYLSEPIADLILRNWSR